MINIAASKRLGLLLLIASSSLSFIQGDSFSYCSYGVECNGDAQGGTWCNENEDNCKDCGGNWCTDEGQHRYIVKFEDTPDNLARARRMESRALEEQLINILPEDNAEVLKLTTEEEVNEWRNRTDVKYVEKDQRVFLQGESTPYGINMVKALSVSDGMP